MLNVSGTGQMCFTQFRSWESTSHLVKVILSHYNSTASEHGAN